jgi:hypothetical protein
VNRLGGLVDGLDDPGGGIHGPCRVLTRLPTDLHTHPHTHTHTHTHTPKPQTTTIKTQEIAAKKEEREQEAIRVKHGARLDEWATDPATKKPRNVRTLLSTMHAVLWEGKCDACGLWGCGW